MTILIRVGGEVKYSITFWSLESHLGVPENYITRDDGQISKVKACGSFYDGPWQRKR